MLFIVSRTTISAEDIFPYQTYSRIMVCDISAKNDHARATGNLVLSSVVNELLP